MLRSCSLFRKKIDENLKVLLHRLDERNTPLFGGSFHLLVVRRSRYLDRKLNIRSSAALVGLGRERERERERERDEESFGFYTRRSDQEGGLKDIFPEADHGGIGLYDTLFSDVHMKVRTQEGLMS